MDTLFEYTRLNVNLNMSKTNMKVKFYRHSIDIYQQTSETNPTLNSKFICEINIGIRSTETFLIYQTSTSHFNFKLRYQNKSTQSAGD